MTIDLSFDLETLGTGPDAVILEIGAVPFDPNGNDTVDSLLSRAARFPLPIQSQLDAGRKVDAGALQFWLNERAKTSDSARLFERVAYQDKHYGHFSQGLDRLLEWCWKTFDVVSELPVPCSWANSPSFDHVKLRGLLELCKRTVPTVLNYRHERDVRTVRDFCGVVDFQVPDLTPHDAVHDAIYQALLVQAAHKNR